MTKQIPALYNEFPLLSPILKDMGQGGRYSHLTDAHTITSLAVHLNRNDAAMREFVDLHLIPGQTRTNIVTAIMEHIVANSVRLAEYYHCYGNFRKEVISMAKNAKYCLYKDMQMFSDLIHSDRPYDRELDEVIAAKIPNLTQNSAEVASRIYPPSWPLSYAASPNLFRPNYHHMNSYIESNEEYRLRSLPFNKYDDE